MAGVRKASVLSIALLLVTLAAGFLGGVAWQKSQVDSVQAEEGEDEQRYSRNDRRMVIDEVGLEPDKRTEVEQIIQHFVVRMRTLNDEFEQAYRPKQRELFREARDSIKSILVPEQRALYDSLLAVRYGNGDRGRDASGEGQGSGRPDGTKER